MDKSKIPTDKVKINDTLEVEFYQWITQDEADQLQVLLWSGAVVDIQQAQDFTIKMNAEQLNILKKFKIEATVKSLTWDEYTVLDPKTRDAILDIAVEICDGEYKKK